MKEPKLGERFAFQRVRDWQAANQQANELGLRARIDFIEYNAEEDDKMLSGKWVLNETPSERPKTLSS